MFSIVNWTGRTYWRSTSQSVRWSSIIGGEIGWSARQSTYWRLSWSVRWSSYYIGGGIGLCTYYTGGGMGGLSRCRRSVGYEGEKSINLRQSTAIYGVPTEGEIDPLIG